jgi:hypothetical protein
MSDSSAESDDSNELAPSKVIQEYATEHRILDSFVKRLSMRIKDYFSSRLSKRQLGPRKRIQLDHVGAHQHLEEDYFAEEPLYPESMFCTRFHMNRRLFHRIVNVLGQ